jgi:hypothetical protein
MNRMIGRVVAVTLAVMAGALVGSAQLNVSEQRAPDSASRRAAIKIETMDRTILPLVQETREMKVDETTTRTESVIRARLNDGSLFDWLRTTSVTRQVGTEATETVTEVVETDRQGRARLQRKLEQTVTRTAEGEKSEEVEYRRDSSGNLVVRGASVALTTKNPDGTLSVRQTQKEADINGRLVPRREVEQTISATGDTEQVIGSEIRSFSHVEGRFAVAARETTVVRVVGETTTTETEIQERVGTGFRPVGRVVTTEVRAADGTLRRETIEHGRAQFARSARATSSEPVVPRRRIVEREVKQPDGSIRLERDVWRMDVNGRWVAESHSLSGIFEPAATPTAY